ncbi:MAG: hypothetical protein ACT4N8_11870 [Sphingosinicella sp.]
MRLHLAKERQDRRGVMAAMDELVGIDRELGRFIAAIPDPALHGIGCEIEAQKRDVIAQRLVLARGKIGPAIAPGEAAAAPGPAAIESDYQVYEPDRRSRRLVAALLALCIVVAAILLLGEGAAQAIVSWWEQPA